jgi:glutamate/tyrosine decarboxylase-like PLP-dependent enzyme
MHELLDRPLPDGPMDPLAVVEELARDADGGLVAMGSGRYFGFVIGGALTGSVAVDWLVSAWDQNTGLAEVTPAASALEAIACASLRRASVGASRERGAERGRAEPGAVPVRRRRDDPRRARRRAGERRGVMSGTIWDGRAAIRLSVSNWRTTSDDIDRAVAAFATALTEQQPGTQVSD